MKRIMTVDDSGRMKKTEKSGVNDAIQRGEVAIQRVANLKEELNCALQRADQVMIRLTETSLVDDACLTLLRSARRNAALISRDMGAVDRFLCQEAIQRLGRC